MMGAKERADSRLRALFANAVGSNPFGTGRLDVKDVEDFIEQVVQASADATIRKIGQEGLPAVDSLNDEIAIANDHISDIWKALNSVVTVLGEAIAPGAAPVPAPAPAPAPQCEPAPAPEWEVILNYLDVRHNPTGNFARIGLYPSEKDAERVAQLLNNLTGSAYLFECQRV